MAHCDRYERSSPERQCFILGSYYLFNHVLWYTTIDVVVVVVEGQNCCLFSGRQPVVVDLHIYLLPQRLSLSLSLPICAKLNTSTW